MEYPRIAFFLFFANLLFLGASYNDFLECLSNQIGNSSSSTNLIYTPENPTFTSLLQTENQRVLSTSRERPDLIVTPSHESEILAAVYCSKKLGLQIKVRSGGHDYEGLSYTSDENPFAVVDMRNFQSISVDVEEKTARVQVGATLGQFYYAIAQKSKTLGFPAGICPTVGVGGHFSGGGYGMISRKHALSSDRIIDAKLINADGEILDRRSMGEDLFWAIRGGGGTSFGIVLEFKVSLAMVPETVTFFNVTRTSDAATELLHRWQYVANKIDENIVLRVFVAVRNKTIVVSFTTLYLGPVTDVLPLMKDKFPELGLVREDCTEMSWIESTLVFAEYQGWPLEILQDRTPKGYFSWKGKSDFVNSPISKKGLKEMWEFMYQYETAHLQFSPYGGVLNNISESETPFPHRKGNIFMIHYSVVWLNPDEPEKEKKVEWLRSFYGFMARYVTKSPRAAYLNYRDLDIGRNNIIGITSYKEASVWGFKYFKNNFKRLVDVKTKVDPSNFFRNEQSIPPLSSNSWGVM